jgi:hypothetical protein
MKNTLKNLKQNHSYIIGDEKFVDLEYKDEMDAIAADDAYDAMQEEICEN